MNSHARAPRGDRQRAASTDSTDSAAARSAISFPMPVPVPIRTARTHRRWPLPWRPCVPGRCGDPSAAERPMREIIAETTDALDHESAVDPR
ncbi:hypothetical protein [Actinosynnema sp. NPDC023587]|uniref:hypothetical protein n=1 Tax=Actinosynnema sp. NPDC023587 TaxID=3154695 RepID=UPI0033ED6D86